MTNLTHGPIFSARREAIRDEVTELCDRHNHLPADDPDRAPLSARIHELLRVEGRLMEVREGGRPDATDADQLRVFLEAHATRSAARHDRLREINHAIAAEGLRAASGEPTLTADAWRELLAQRDRLAEHVLIEDQIGREAGTLLALAEGD